LTLASLLDELSELDRNPTHDYLSAREQAIAAIAAACLADPEAAAQHLPLLNQALARTAQLRVAAEQERAEIQSALRSLKAHLQQLKSFSVPAAADEPLLNRLA